jgi:hypothetical protein
MTYRERYRDIERKKKIKRQIADIKPEEKVKLEK